MSAVWRTCQDHSKALCRADLAWVVTATLNWNFRTPIARELMLLLGFIDASAPTLRRVLKVELTYLFGHCARYSVVSTHAV